MSNLVENILLEAKQRGVLYHFTSNESAISILEENILNSSLISNTNNDFLKGKYTKGVSLTRDKFFHTENRSTSDIKSTEVKISLNGALLSNRYKIIPYNYFANTKKIENKPEFEELVLTEVGITPIIPYILQLEILDFDTKFSNALFEICKKKEIFTNIEEYDYLF